MPCRPFFGDQRLNIKYVCRLWKVDLELDNEFERGKIHEAVRKLMGDKDGEKVRQRAVKFKEKAKIVWWRTALPSSHQQFNGTYLIMLTTRRWDHSSQMPKAIPLAIIRLSIFRWLYSKA
jgi:hypothetical protein